MSSTTITHPARAVAHVDLGAVAANCRLLASKLTAGAELCAVVKADGYGHGMTKIAEAAIAGGATRLAVVTVEEAEVLSEAAFGVPLLVMAPVASGDLERAFATGAELTAWTPEQVRGIAAASRAADVETGLHVKLDSGMGRFGAKTPEQALEALAIAEQEDGVRPTAVWTHFATADEPGDDYFDVQLDRFTEFVATALLQHPDLLAHAANSAATLRDPASHFDFVRCGIAVYGLDPFQDDPLPAGLMPALSLTSYVAAARPFAAGESSGYGQRFKAERDTVLATVPIGYGDGWRRVLTNNCEVLIGGRRYPQVGTVSMDSITIDLGPDSNVAEGDLVTLIGADGGERILTEEVARRARTINYEITCGLTPRTAREYTPAPPSS
jgi:alanine racemase